MDRNQEAASDAGHKGGRKEAETEVVKLALMIHFTPLEVVSHPLENKAPDVDVGEGNGDDGIKIHFEKKQSFLGTEILYTFIAKAQPN